MANKQAWFDIDQFETLAAKIDMTREILMDLLDEIDQFVAALVADVKEPDPADPEKTITVTNPRKTEIIKLLKEHPVLTLTAIGQKIVEYKALREKL